MTFLFTRAITRGEVTAFGILFEGRALIAAAAVFEAGFAVAQQELWAVLRIFDAMEMTK
jgi:hypothetical protein